jgi:hypothetical protein
MQGVVRSEVAFSLAPGKVHTLSANGTIEGRGVHLPLEDHLPRIHNLDFDLGFLDHDVDLTRFSLQLGPSPVHGHGSFVLGRPVRGRIFVRSSHLDAGNILAGISDRKKNAAQKLDVRDTSGKGLPYEMDLEVFVDAGRLKNLRFGPFHALARLKDGQFAIERGRLDFPTGLAAVESSEETGGSRRYQGYLRFDDLPLGPLLDALGAGEMGAVVEGPLDVAGYVYGRGGDFSGLVDSMRGNMALEAGPGIIRKSNVMSQVLQLLNIKNILTLDFSDINQGIPFDLMEGYFHVENGTVRTDDFILKSPVLNAASTGKLSLRDQTVDAKLAVQPFGTVDSLVSKIPIAGYILTGKEKSLVSYSFDVTGSVRDPKVTYVPLVDLPASFFGYIKRILLTPARIFDRDRVDQEMKRDQIRFPKWLDYPPGVITSAEEAPWQ